MHVTGAALGVCVRFPEPVNRIKNIPYEQKFWHGIKIGELADAHTIAKLKSCH